MGKRQHFVPQVLLRCFATDTDKKFINIYNLKTNKIITNGLLSTQGYEDYLYGKDQELENEYQKIENNIQGIFKKLLLLDTKLSSDELFDLKIFLNFQICRTPAMKEKMNEMDSMLISGIAENDKEVEDILNEESKKAEEPFIRLFRTAIGSAITLCDLKLGLVINKTEIPLVLGQHPVNVLNPFLYERKWEYSINGLASKGAIIFMPLSKEIGIVLYDPIRYRFVSFKNTVTINVEDVNKLNTVQFATTQECVYYQGNIDIDILNSYNISTIPYRKGPKSKIDKIKCRIDGKKGIQEILHTSQMNLPVEQKFCFVGITENAYYENLGNTIDISRETVKPYLNHDYSRKYEIKRKK